MEQLSTMGEFSRDKDNQNKIVKNVNAQYDALVSAINSKEMGHFKTQADIRSNFGDPLAVKNIIVNGQKQQEWLYRYALIKTAKSKVYLYFDERGNLLNYKEEKIEW